MNPILARLGLTPERIRALTGARVQTDAERDRDSRRASRRKYFLDNKEKVRRQKAESKRRCKARERGLA